MAATIVGFVGGVLFASLVEYGVHRAMHRGWIMARRHREHHRDGWAQGVVPELVTYALPGAPLVAATAWWIGGPAGQGWAAGCGAFMLFAAYAHQLQHDAPVACRWMRVPVHYVHHRDQMWHHNFGLTFDWWDRVFGSYRRAPFGEELDAEQRARGALDIGWWGPPTGWRRPAAGRQRAGVWRDPGRSL
jgi:sterol desaturase/sphingolipid hydroxylase (fatty acid hydroxylase superfamily)